MERKRSLRPDLSLRGSGNRSGGYGSRSYDRRRSRIAHFEPSHQRSFPQQTIGKSSSSPWHSNPILAVTSEELTNAAMPSLTYQCVRYIQLADGAGARLSRELPVQGAHNAGQLTVAERSRYAERTARDPRQTDARPASRSRGRPKTRHTEGRD